MYTLDKYIVSGTAKAYFLLLSVFTGLYVIIELFSELGNFIAAKTAPAIISSYYLNMLPLIFLRVSPLSLLIAVIYTFAELNKNNELLGIRAIGVTLFRTSRGILTLSLVISVAALFAQETLLLDSQRKVERISLNYVKNSQDLTREEKNIAFRNNNNIFFITRFLPKKKYMEEVIVFQEDETGEIKNKIVARRVDYINGIWIARDVVSYSLEKSGKIIDAPLYWREKILDMDESPETIVAKKSLFEEGSSIRILKKEREKMRSTKTQNFLLLLTIELHKKIAEPFFHIFLVIGVLPFAMEIKKRKAGLSSLGLGFIFGFVYYVIFSTSLALGKAGVIIPHLCVWAAPLFFVIIGISGLFLLR